jgi:hypothetical protein
MKLWNSLLNGHRALSLARVVGAIKLSGAQALKNSCQQQVRGRSLYKA